MEALTDDQQEKVRSFESIAGIEADKETDKIIRLLTINDWDLNNAISNYFDSQFKSVELPSHTNSTGYEYHDTMASEMTHRHHASRDNIMNLQDQLFAERYEIRLPRAPRIQNRWQFDLGIYSSLNDTDEQSKENKDETTGLRQNTLWIILLLIPRTLFNLLVSLLRLLASLLNSSKTLRSNGFPHLFDFEKYRVNYSLLKEIERGQHTSKETESEKQGLLAGSSFDDNAFSDESTDGGSSSMPQLTDKFDLREQDFNDAHKDAQTNYKWLLIALVNDEKESLQFLRKLLESERFRELFHAEGGIHKECVIFVGNITRSPEAHEVGKAYRARKLPFIALAGNVSGSSSVMPSMSLIYKSNISFQSIQPENVGRSIERISTDMGKVLEKYAPQLITQRIDKQEIEISRLLKQQQDDAYKESLERDRIKKVEKENEMKLKQEAETLAKLRYEFLLYLLQKDWFSKANEGAENKIKLSIRLPNGNRVIESVLSTLLLTELYLFVELKLFIQDQIASPDNAFDDENDVLLHISSLELSEPSLSVTDYPEIYPFRFHLIQPFPKFIIPPSGSSMDAINELKHGGNLLVEFKDDTSSEEEEEEEEEEGEGEGEGDEDN